MSRKAFTAAVVAATIAWSISLSAFLAPLTAQATVMSGSLIKASLPAVYYVGADGKRYVFPNEKTYKTWYADFSTVQVITDAQLATYAIGGNVTYRPGIKMVKIQTDPKTYAVSKGGVLHWVKSEALATSLYGVTWNQKIDDVSDAFFVNYTVGSDINSASDYSPAVATASSPDINTDKGLTGISTAAGLSFSLSSDTPASATVPAGASGVNFVKFDVHNGSSSSQTVDTVVVHRVGPGAPADFDAVYLFEGNTRLTTSRTVNTTTNDSTFTGLHLSLNPGQTRSLWVAADIDVAPGAGDVSAFEVESVMVGSASAVGVARGNDMTFAAVQVGTIKISKSGTLTDPKVGQLNAQIAEFQLNAGAKEDLMVRRITLFQGGSLSRNDLSNLVLKQGGSTVATAATVDDKDHIVLVFNSPQALPKGSTKTYDLYGDIGGGARVDETLAIYAEENVDVWATGNTYGYGVTVDRDTYEGTACDPVAHTGNCSGTEVKGGQITISFNGPAAHDVPTNGKDVELFNFTMAAQSNVEVRKISFDVNTSANHGDGVNPYYTDIKVTDTATGAVVAGPKDGAIGANNAEFGVDYTDIFNLSAGQSRTFKVTTDIAQDTAPGTITVTLDAFGGTDIRNLDNSTYVNPDDIVPSGDIVGNPFTVKAATLKVSASSTPVAQTYIQGSQNVALYGVSLKAGDSQDITVSSITVQCYIDASNGDADILKGQDTDAGHTQKCSDDVLTAKLWNGSTQVGDTKSPTASGADDDGGLLQFTNVNVHVPHGQTVTLMMTGSLASQIANIADGPMVQFEVTDQDSIASQDPDGNNVDEDGLPATGNVMTLAEAGTITVARAPDDTESEAGLVVGNSTNAVLAKYRMTAQSEELKLTKARMAIAGGSVAAVNSMSLYDGSTLVAGPVSVDSDGNADFSGMSFVIPKDGSKTLTVKGNLNSVGPSGAASGLDLKVTMCDGDADSNGGNCADDSTGTFEVRGTSAGSSTDIKELAATVDGRSKIIRRTKPTVTVVALPSSTLTNGTQVISRFTVSADGADQVAVKKIAFNVALNDVLGGADLTLTSSGDSSVRQVGQGSNILGSADYTGCTASADSVTCTVNIVFDSEETITAGTSKTYDLRAAIVGADEAGESVTTNLLGDAAQVTGELDNNGGDAEIDLGIDDNDGTAADDAYNFLWSDNSAVPHNDTVDNSFAAFNNAAAVPAPSLDWTNGRFVKVLPSDTQTVTRS